MSGDFKGNGDKRGKGWYFSMCLFGKQGHEHQEKNLGYMLNYLPYGKERARRKCNENGKKAQRRNGMFLKMKL